MKTLEEEEKNNAKHNQEEFSLKQVILEDKEMQVSLESLNWRIKRIEAYTPGSPRHLNLMRHCLNLMNDKNMKGVEANLEVSLRPIDTQE
jgi:hypothetical protein